MHKYRGVCDTEGCEKNGDVVIFEVPADKVQAYTHEPPICIRCHRTLNGMVAEMEPDEEIVNY